MVNITLKQFEVKGDEILLYDGRLVGGLLPELPSIIRAEVIDLLEEREAYDLDTYQDILIDKFTDLVINLFHDAKKGGL